MNQAAESENSTNAPMPGYILVAEAVKKYGVTTSLLYNSKKIRRLQNGWVNEADIMSLIASPKFKTASAALKKVLRHKKENSIINEEKESDIESHTAYLAGYFQRTIEEYASGHGLSSRILTNGIFKILSNPPRR